MRWIEGIERARKRKRDRVKGPTLFSQRKKNGPPTNKGAATRPFFAINKDGALTNKGAAPSRQRLSHAHGVCPQASALHTAALDSALELR